MTLEDSKSKPRAADQLVAHFEALIRSGQLEPGKPLPPEREIVQEHGVSRTVVREAVLVLANRGLVKAQPRFRPVVATPGYDTAVNMVGGVIGQLLEQDDGVKNLFELRIMMEASLVRGAALNASADDIRRLETALANNKEAVDDSARFYETDTVFHGILYEIPKNPVLPSIHRAYTDWLSGPWSKMPRSPERNEVNYLSHAAIFDAILRRDPDAAEAALRAHMDFAWTHVKEILEDG